MKAENLSPAVHRFATPPALAVHGRDNNNQKFRGTEPRDISRFRNVS